MWLQMIIFHDVGWLARAGLVPVEGCRGDGGAGGSCLFGSLWVAEVL
jgi:hypothetical protein